MIAASESDTICVSPVVSASPRSCAAVPESVERCLTHPRS